jgi:hypothetical protein
MMLFLRKIDQNLHNQEVEALDSPSPPIYGTEKAFHLLSQEVLYQNHIHLPSLR